MVTGFARQPAVGNYSELSVNLQEDTASSSVVPGLNHALMSDASITALPVSEDFVADEGALAAAGMSIEGGSIDMPSAADLETEAVEKVAINTPSKRGRKPKSASSFEG